MPSSCSLGALHRFIQVSNELKREDKVASYWVQVYFQEQAIKILPSCRCIDWRRALDFENLEYTNLGMQAINNMNDGKIYMQNLILIKLARAERCLHSGIAYEQAAKLFHLSTILIKSMSVFGPLSEDNLQKYHYAKYKTSYLKACLISNLRPRVWDPSLEHTDWG